MAYYLEGLSTDVSWSPFSFLMYYPQAVRLYLTAALFLSFTSIHVLAEVVLLDSQTAGINYDPSVGSVAGGWERIADPTDTLGGFMMATNPGSTATITCSFINASFWSPKWPFPVTTALTIDGVTTILDLQDYSFQVLDTNGTGYSPSPSTHSPSIISSIVYAYSGDANAEHTIVVSMFPHASSVIFDMFSFDTTNWTISTGSPPASTTPSTSTTTSVDPTHTDTLTRSTLSTLTATPTSSLLSTLTATPTSSTLSTGMPEMKVPLNVPTTSTAHPNATSSSSVLPVTAATHKKTNTMVVTIGASVGGVLAFLSCILVSYLCCIYRRRRRGRPDKTKSYTDPIPYPATARSPGTGVFGTHSISSIHSTKASGSQTTIPAQSHQSYGQDRTLLTQSNTSQSRLISPAQSHQPHVRPQEDGSNTPSTPNYKELPILADSPPARSTLRVTSFQENSLNKVVYPAERKGSAPTIMEWDPSSRYRPSTSYGAPVTSLRKNPPVTITPPTLGVHKNAGLLKTTRVSKLSARSRSPLPPPYQIGDEYFTH